MAATAFVQMLDSIHGSVMLHNVVALGSSGFENFAVMLMLGFNGSNRTSARKRQIAILCNTTQHRTAVSNA
jgi:hypothetical protein